MHAGLQTRICLISIVIKINPTDKVTEMLWTVLTRRVVLGLGLAGLLLTAQAADQAEVMLVIKDHKFEPAELKVPAGQKVRILVHNQDKTPEEFESTSLKREKVIPGGAKVPVLVGPLKAGRYEFVGEFHEATARGVLIAE